MESAPQCNLPFYGPALKSQPIGGQGRHDHFDTRLCTQKQVLKTIFAIFGLKGGPGIESTLTNYAEDLASVVCDTVSKFSAV